MNRDSSSLGRFRRMQRLADASKIARRYFVVNGFDGALTMLGLSVGFATAAAPETGTVLRATFGAGVALFFSGLSSAYLSESAEQRSRLKGLEAAMVTSLDASAHAEASRWMPLMVAAVNGLAPLSVSLAVLTPLTLAHLGLMTLSQALSAAIAIAFASVFGLGAFLGRISGTFWLAAAVRALLIGGGVALVIYLVGS